jgi:3-oxoacyl-[acyl-carrier protein] reductase
LGPGHRGQPARALQRDPGGHPALEAARRRRDRQHASVAGRRISFGGGANYSASKAGLLGFTRHAAYELAPDKIRVNAVCPGPTATAFGGGQVPSTERKAERAKKIPLGRMVEPADIADAVLFLASDMARMCTGIALDVDGGVLISNNIPYDEYFARAR